MKHTKNVTIEVNGKTIEAVITIEAPGLDVIEDALSADMILAAAGKGQDTSYVSRHHKDRVAKVLVNSQKVDPASALPSLAEARRRKHLQVQPGADTRKYG